MEEGILREERGGKRRWRREGQESREEKKGKGGKVERRKEGERGESNLRSFFLEEERERVSRDRRRGTGKQSPPPRVVRCKVGR
jgi:hypothetical protein